MADLPAVHRRAAEGFASLVPFVDDDAWDRPTPCEGWSVRDLVNHVVSGNLWAAELAAGRTIDEVGDRLDGDVLGDTPAAAAESSGAAASAAFAADGAMDAPCAVSYGPVPGSVYCGHRIVDLVGHRWDLATAAGLDTTLPDDQVAAAIEIVLPQHELLAGSGMFGDASDPGPDVAPQDRLLRLLGR